MATPLPKLKPTGLRARIIGWMLQHPGEHRPRDVAAGLSPPETDTTAQWTTKVNTAMTRMHHAGVLTRERRSEAAHGPGSYYRITSSDQAPEDFQ